MSNQDNKIAELAQLESENEKQQNSTAHSIDVSSLDVVEIVIEMGKGVVDVASSVLENIDIDF
ncbi:hypothetical protein [Acinetobacter dispersus]|uniref:Uncharacterized protein n=1 Tax=Acinetobacter dispersus TaxID=70348 RepID=N9L7X2_9GAMM|nr:hypothetical protein [Acinetobacter dispersus]ENW92387.1 hypothetical protein F904_02326 [Acinetobacter dispersus]